MTSRCIAIALAGLMLSACVAEDAPDFCKNHALFHGEHQGESAQLVVEMSDQGQVRSEIQLLSSIAGDAKTAARLGNVASVMMLETSSKCDEATVEVESLVDTVRATYVSECGADNKLEQVNVLLFDAFPEFDEVVVHVTTPVTEKHFAIHRQCASAIFRLQ